LPTSVILGFYKDFYFYLQYRVF